jgi:membrane-associated phospholipid phosphatase
MSNRAKTAAIGAGAGVVLLALTWFAAFQVGFVEHADLSILRGFVGLHRPRVNQVANFVANLCTPSPYVYLAATPVLVALLRRRPRVAMAIGVILLGANETTQLLKPLLAHPRPTLGLAPVGAAAWPSGHATAAMSLALCLVVSVPARVRPLVAALGAAFAIAVCYAFLTLGWHFPTDVLGGFLVAATWTCAGVAGLSALEERNPRTESSEAGALSSPASLRATLGPPAAALAAGIALIGVIALVRPHGVVSYARAHEAFIVGAAGIAVLGLILATGLAVALRR